MAQATKWWGWGPVDQRYPAERLSRVLGLLESRGLPARDPLGIPDPEPLPPSRLKDRELRALREIAPVAVGEQDRLAHSLGKSYLDLLAARRGGPEEATDAVVLPESEEAVLPLIRFADSQGIAVVPFGGGTSVLGGVRPLTGGYPAVVTVDLQHLDQITAVDETALLADVEAGIRGPPLEAGLQSRGFTLGMYPQSYHFSSLGGWIATRASGHLSGGYGGIGDLLRGVRVATPQGILASRTVPARSTGPSMRDLVLGSEGIMGIIVSATLRVRRQPTERPRTALLYQGFSKALDVCRHMVQSGIRPTLLRASDRAETSVFAALAGLEAEEAPCVVLLGFDGHEEAPPRLEEAVDFWASRGGLDLGPEVVASWEDEYYATPYLRDDLVDRGYLVDTLETAASWSALWHVYVAAREALHRAFARQGVQALVLCHLSTAYADGASLYFTLLAPQLRDREVAQWWEVKTAVTEAILDHHGTLSHHHGIGVDHRQWMVREHGETAVAALQGLKSALDPKGIMNPGKVLEAP